MLALLLRTRTPCPFGFATTSELRNPLVKQLNTRHAPKLHTDGRPPYASVGNFPYVCNCLITYIP